MNEMKNNNLTEDVTNKFAQELKESEWRCELRIILALHNLDVAIANFDYEVLNLR